MALGKIGANRITDYENNSTLEAIYCRTFYEQTRDESIRSHQWRFASARQTLSEDAETPDFQWAHQYLLPDDFMRLKDIFEENATPLESTLHTFAIEGKMLLTDDSTCQIRYVKKVTDVTEFDSLFVQFLVLKLAQKLVMAISQDKGLSDRIEAELAFVMPRIRAMDRQETNTIRRHELRTWNGARTYNGGRIDSQLGS
jgi:hypothetical protein